MAGHDQHAAHRRRSGFFLMRLRTFLAYVLLHLHFAEALDHPGAQQQRQQQAVMLATACAP